MLLVFSPPCHSRAAEFDRDVAQLSARLGLCASGGSHRPDTAGSSRSITGTAVTGLDRSIRSGVSQAACRTRCTSRRAHGVPGRRKEPDPDLEHGRVMSDSACRNGWKAACPVQSRKRLHKPSPAILRWPPTASPPAVSNLRRFSAVAAPGRSQTGKSAGLSQFHTAGARCSMLHCVRTC